MKPNNLKNQIFILFWLPLIIAQYILSFFYTNDSSLVVVRYMGWALLIVHAIFAWVPIFTLKSKGRVPKGKSFLQTTKVVDTGIYSIVRHPQYLSGIFFTIAIACISQHVLIIFIGLFIIPLLYLDIIQEDEKQLEKFGNVYVEYSRKVPMVNFVLGIVRKIRR